MIVNYNRQTFIVQATGHIPEFIGSDFCLLLKCTIHNEKYQFNKCIQPKLYSSLKYDYMQY